MFSLREYRQRPDRLPDLLPWASLVAPGVVLQKDAVFQKTLAFRGPDLASSPIGARLWHRAAQQRPAALRLRLGPLRRGAARIARATTRRSTWPNAAAWLRRPRTPREFPARRRALRVELLPHLRLGPARPRGTRRAEALFYEDPADGRRRNERRRSTQPPAVPQDRLRARRHHGWRLPRGAGARRRRDAHLPAQHRLDPPAPRQSARHADVPRRVSCPTWRSRLATCRCSATASSPPARSPRFLPAPTLAFSTLSTTCRSSTAGSRASSSSARRKRRRRSRSTESSGSKSKGLWTADQGGGHEAGVSARRQRRSRQGRRR